MHSCMSFEPTRRFMLKTFVRLGFQYEHTMINSNQQNRQTIRTMPAIVNVNFPCNGGI
jgi:hypothetical protein